MTDMDIDFNEPPFDIESGRYNWDVFHASPHARAKEKMLRNALKMASLATGAGAVGLLYKAKRAYQRFMGGHNLNPMPNIVSPSGKKKRKRRGNNLRGQYPKVPRGAPYPIEPPSMPSSTSNAGTQTVVPPPPLNTTNTVVKIVGDAGMLQKSCVVYMKSNAGWKFRPETYRNARRMYSPIVLKIGDCLSDDVENTNSVPSWINTAGQDPKDMTLSSHFRMWHTASIVGGTAPTRSLGKRTTFKMAGKSNNYCDLCLPILPCSNFSRLNIEGNLLTDHPLCIENIFSKVGQDGAVGVGQLEYNLAEWAGGPHFLDTFPMETDVQIKGDRFGSGYDSNCFMTLESEFRIFNSSSKACNYEVYMCYPKTVSDHSPLYSFDEAYKVSAETKTSMDGLIFGTADLMHKSVGYTPTSLKDFNNLWRVQKKNFCVAGGHAIVVKHRVPLSLLRSDIIAKMKAQQTNCNIPGLTSWFWVRAYGNFGWDAATGVGGYGPGNINIQMYQKIKVLKSLVQLTKRVDTTCLPNFDITPDETLANENNT